MSIGRNAKTCVNHNHWSTDYKFDSTMNFTTIMLGHKKRQVRLQADVSYDPFQIFPDLQHVKHYCPVKILDLEINRVDHHPLGR